MEKYKRPDWFKPPDGVLEDYVVHNILGNYESEAPQVTVFSLWNEHIASVETPNIHVTKAVQEASAPFKNKLTLFVERKASNKEVPDEIKYNRYLGNEESYGEKCKRKLKESQARHNKFWKDKMEYYND